MKPDGVTMETTEPTEAAALAEPSSLQENVTEEAPFQPTAETEAAPQAKDEPPAAEPKVESKAGGNKIQSMASGSKSRVGTASHRAVNDVKASAAAPGGRKVATTASRASAAGAVPKRPASAAAVSSTARNQTKGLDKRPVGPGKTTTSTSATVTNGTRPKTMNGPSKRPAAEAANGARPKTTTTVNKTTTSTALKSSISTTTTRPSTASSKTTRPAAVLSTSRATATKPSTTATAKPAASRVATAPPAGRTQTAHVPKTTAAARKADVSRPPSAAPTRKPTTDSAPVATKKHEPSKPTMKLTSVPKCSTTTRAVDAKVSQSKAPHPVKPNPTKRPVAATRLPLTNKPPLGRTPPASPASKYLSHSSPATKRGTKPTQTVPPFLLTKKKNAAVPPAETQDAASSVEAAATEAESPAEATVTLQQEQSDAASAVEKVPTHVSEKHTAADVEPREDAAPSSLQSPIRTTPPTSVSVEPLEKSPPSGTLQEQVSSPARPSSPPVADLPQENVDLKADDTPSRSTAIPAVANPVSQMVPHSNLNEDEDEEEREGSQLVSVSEMSGTTQPTEESRPGSGGPVGGSPWRAGGALLSELDSEEVSGSQQGASELSAPGVLEGTESTDDLGDGSLKGAMDMEGASAGSPDFEKVPDIPVNDFDDDEDEDEDDSDRVCDMDVGSERTDEQQRPRHDNDVDEEQEDEEEDEDDDVEMASEGVTESGLESYGNADEDDFAEDERLDNLNRVAQPPPPPPVLPSAPAAQWEQPNPFAEALQPQLVLDATHAAAAASPLTDPMQADSETPTQTPAQDWQEQELVPFAPNEQDIPQHSTEPQSTEAQQKTESSQAKVKTSAPETPSSNTPNRKTTMPGDQGDQNPDAAQMLVHFLQPDLDSQDLGIHLGRGDEEFEEEAEPETLPADEILEGPATAPLSNPSSSSVTEDEASDTEGEAQLNESSKSSMVINTTFDTLPPSQRSLSTVEEGEEAESGGGDEATPPSAASLTSYGFDSVATASSSNAQSTESCIKSPGIFSLEELPEEAKDQSFLQQPHTQQCDAEHQYIECGKQEAEAARHVWEEMSASDPSSNEQGPEEVPDDTQPSYYSICEKTEDSFAGFTALPHHHRRDHASYPRIYCDIVKPHIAAVPSAKLSCADLPPRSPGQQARSPQLRRLEQHQRQLLELQQRREQQSRPLEEAEQERKRRAEEEERRKKEEAEEELKRNKEEVRKKKKEEEEEQKKMEEMKVKERAQVRRKEEEELEQRRDLELQLQQQQQELKQRQQIMQWQQELQQAALLSPSSGLCTIYEALENSEDEDETGEQNVTKDESKPAESQQMSCETARSDEDKHEDSSLSDSLPSDSTRSSNNSSCPPKSPERPPPLDLDWGKKVDIVQQLINQTLLLNGDGCSSLLLLPGGTGGTLSPLESSLWPSLLPPLTPPSATVTSVSSFSPEATGSSPQGEWTVVELETHH